MKYRIVFPLVYVPGLLVSISLVIFAQSIQVPEQDLTLSFDWHYLGKALLMVISGAIGLACFFANMALGGWLAMKYIQKSAVDTMGDVPEPLALMVYCSPFIGKRLVKMIDSNDDEQVGQSN